MSVSYHVASSIDPENYRDDIYALLVIIISLVPSFHSRAIVLDRYPHRRFLIIDLPQRHSPLAAVSIALLDSRRGETIRTTILNDPAWNAIGKFVSLPRSYLKRWYIYLSTYQKLLGPRKHADCGGQLRTRRALVVRD
jgi:hypothetical protein